MYSKSCSSIITTVLCASCALGQARKPLTVKDVLDDVKARPEFRHSFFGVEVYSLDQKKLLYALNADQLFVPGSTGKLFTAGTALHYLGANYRFQTPVYRTGPVNEGGEMKGDLILVASGDPNLSGRLQKDGTLGFADEDHSYGGPASKVIGNPMAALNEIASQIYAAGIRKVDGRVRIDINLFPEGARELGTGSTLSPIVVNDNFIDVLITPGPNVGSPAKFTILPQVPFIRFTGGMTTGTAGSKLNLVRKITTEPDGTLDVTTTGSIPQDYGVDVASFAVPSPSRFAQALLVEALHGAGVTVLDKSFVSFAPGESKQAGYSIENRVANYTSPPLSEEIKVMLKVSQNLHASNMPYLLGAVVGKAKENVDQKGFDLEHDFLSLAGLDLTSASQSAGAGGISFFTPDFVSRYLAYMTTQPNFEYFERALPILGRDGTLADVSRASPAAGALFAKTGTTTTPDLLNRNVIACKGLAGYTTTPAGEHVVFALYVNQVPVADRAAVKPVADALGEIGAAIHLLPIEVGVSTPRQ